jgi:hypothetical protein
VSGLTHPKNSSVPGNPNPIARARFFRAAGCIAILLVLGTGRARGQGLVAQSEGLNTGRVVLYPSVTFDYTDDSNVLYRSADLSSSQIVHSGVVLVRPRLMVDLPIGRSRVLWSYSPLYRNYTTSQFQQSRHVSHFFDLEGVLKPGSGLTIAVRDHFVRGTIEVDQVDPGGELTFGLVPFIVHEPSMDISLDLGARQGVSVLPRYSSVDVSNSTESGFFSYNTRALEARYNYRVSEAATLYVFSNYEATHQDREQLIFGQVQVAGRTTGVGLRRLLNQAVVTEMSAGYETMNFTGGTASKSAGLRLQGNANLRLGDLTRLDVSAARGPYQSFYVNNNFYISRQVRVAITQQIGRGAYYEVGVTSFASHYADPLDIRVTSETPPGNDVNPPNGYIDQFESLIPSQGIRRRDNGLRVELGGGYQFTPKMRLFLGYNRERRDSNIVETVSGEPVAPFDYRVNRLFMRVVLGWM